MLLFRQLNFGSFFYKSCKIFTAVITDTGMVWVHKLGKLVLIKVLFDDHVVGLGTIFEPQVELGELLLSSEELAADVVNSLVGLLWSQFSFTQGEVGLQVGDLNKQLLVFKGGNIWRRLLL